MTKKETIKVLAVLNATYPSQFMKLDTETKEAMIDLWNDIFAQDQYLVVIQAVKNYISSDTKGFFPVIGAIKESIRKINNPNEMTEQEAVNVILHSLENAYYKPQESFDKLPSILKRIVGSPNQLKQWSIMDNDAVQSVVASNISRTYRVLLKQQQEQQILNPRLNGNKLKELEKG